MTVEELILELQEIVAEKPEVKDWVVLSSSDEEGNSKHKLHNGNWFGFGYSPNLEEYEIETYCEEDLEDEFLDEEEKQLMKPVFIIYP